MRFPRIVLGYHGCLQPLASDLLTGRKSVSDWPVSRNDWDWLGEGIYFWEHGPNRAWQWALEKARRTGGEPAVVGAVIRLDDVLDLTDVRFTPLLQATHTQLVEEYSDWNLPLPENTGSDPDLRRRNLDCLVINTLCGLTQFEIVRGAFEEGHAAFPGSKIRQQTHIQLAVRDTQVVAGVFRPVLERDLAR